METRSSSTLSRGEKDSAYHGRLMLGVGGKVHLECREERCDIDCGRLRLRLTALPARDDQQYAACFPTSLASHPFSAIDALLMSDHFVMAQNPPTTSGAVRRGNPPCHGTWCRSQPDGTMCSPWRAAVASPTRLPSFKVLILALPYIKIKENM